MNELDQPPGGIAQKILRILMYAAPIAIFLGIGTLYVLTKSDKLDENLCPVNNQPMRQTVLLIDTSDPLSPKHHEELKRLVRELQEPSSTPNSEHFYVAPGEALIVYELTADWRNLKSYIKVCNPGNNPQEDWDWKKDLTQGKSFASRNWKHFEEKIKEIFPSESSEEMPHSPILESLSVIVPRHVPSKRNLPPGGVSHTHLILFSDLLQNSELLSHYESYPKAKDFLRTLRLRELKTDLTRVDVSIFRLERSKYSRWQTTDHFFWWSKLVREFEGTVRWQDAI